MKHGAWLNGARLSGTRLSGTRLSGTRLSIAAMVTVLTLSQISCNGDIEKVTQVPLMNPAELKPAGDATVSYKPFPSFMLPVANMPEGARPAFHAGKALARQPWIKAPTATDARDGLGPLYNARTCLSCHIKGGRGSLPVNGDASLFAAFVRVSIPGEDKINGVVPEPTYGTQIQAQSVSLSHQLRSVIKQKDPADDKEAPPEAQVYLQWDTSEFTYPDGLVRELRRPTLRFENLGYGALHPEALFSLRAAPAIHGVGLLEKVAQRDINERADPSDEDGDGVSGRVNRVWDFEQNKTVPGRFGWKANRASVKITTASAFNGDVGITNPLFPQQPCSELQPRCMKTPTGNGSEGVELPAHLLQLVVDFTRNLGVPKRRGTLGSTEKGRTLFYQGGCSSCHTPSYVTSSAGSGANQHLANQLIWPYTDLLLHDMGEDLADHRPDYEASGAEWRTPPLWGLGLSAKVNGSSFLLHDGRARNIEEAILWHGGEALSAKEWFIRLTQPRREALLGYIESL